MDHPPHDEALYRVEVFGKARVRLQPLLEEDDRECKPNKRTEFWAEAYAKKSIAGFKFRSGLNLAGLAAINRELIAKAETIESPQRVGLDIDTSEIRE